MSVQGVSFTTKPVLPTKILKPSQYLLQRMNQSTKYVETKEGKTFTSQIVPSILINGNVTLADTRFIVAPVKKDVLMQGEAKLSLREPNVSIYFDRKTGEINSVEPPQYQYSINQFYPLLKKQLNHAKKDFDKSGVVKKRTIGISGYTQKGYERINEVVKSVEAKRSEQTSLVETKPVKKSLLESFFDKILEIFD